jgi:hypothetical protein
MVLLPSQVREVKPVGKPAARQTKWCWRAPCSRHEGDAARQIRRLPASGLFRRSHLTKRVLAHRTRLADALDVSQQTPLDPEVGRLPGKQALQLRPSEVSGHEDSRMTCIRPRAPSSSSPSAPAEDRSCDDGSPWCVGEDGVALTDRGLVR